MGSSVAAVLVVFALLGALLLFARRAARMGPSSLALRVVDAINLGGGRTVTVVRSGQRYFLLGTTTHAVSLIAELDARDLAETDRNAGARDGLPQPVMSAFLKSPLFKRSLLRNLRNAR